MRHLVPSLGATAALLFTAATVVQAETILIEGTRSKLSINSDIRLTGDMKKSFAFFKKNAEFYGAIFVNPAEDLVGAFWNTTSLSLAEHYALKSCKSKSRTPAGCQHYATVIPKKRQQGAGRTLSQSGNLTYAAYRKRQVKDTYGAFAITENGDSGFSWNAPTEIQAEAIAMELCAENVRANNRDASAHVLKNVLEAKRSKCRVVHVSHP